MNPSNLGGPLERAAAEAVRNYLDALRAGPRPPGPHLTRTELRRRLARIDFELATPPPPMVQLRLLQERENLRERDRWLQQEDAFVEVARTYSRRHGISHQTWRQVGVPSSVLRRAGIPPGRKAAQQPET